MFELANLYENQLNDLEKAKEEVLRLVQEFVGS